MPFIPDRKQEVLEEKLLQLPDFEGETPKAREIAMATFRTENSIGSFISQEAGLPDGISNPDYNPWDELTDSEKIDEQFLSNAIRADNTQELEAVRRQSVKESRDRETISKGGAMSFAMGFGVGGLADPINLIPIGGSALKTYKTGSSIFRSGMVTGSVGAASTTAQEVALHATQIERTYGESAINVSASFFLSGLLGIGVDKLANLGASQKTFDEITDTMDVEKKINSGTDSVGAARVDGDIRVKGNAAIKATIKATGIDPLSRTVLSKSKETRRVVDKLVENVFEMEGATPKTSIETLSKLHDGKYIRALELHQKEYASLQQELGGKTGIRAFNKKGISRKEFSERTSREVRNPSPDELPQIKRAAEAWKKELYEPLKDEAIAAKLLPEDVDVTTAVNYLNRVWNKQKMAANAPVFLDKVSKWLEAEDAKLFGDIGSLKSQLKKGGSKADIDKLELRIKKAEHKQDLNLEKQDYEHIAMQIYQRITGTPDGRLPYDWKIGDGSKSFGTAGTKLKSPLKSRTFNIPDELMEEFLENDVEMLGGRYLRQMAVDVELAKAYDGDVTMAKEIKAVQDDWSLKIANETDPKKRVKLEKLKDRDIKDIAGMRDRIRGTYGQVDFSNPWVRMGRVVRDLNYLRFMGGVVASSIPDVARVFMAEGFAKTFRHGIKPLLSNLKALKVSAAEGKRFGIGASAMSSRSEIIADVADYTQGGTAFERLTRSGAQKFGRINLMDQWTNGMKQLHVVTMQSSVLDGLSKGKYDKRLGRLGVSKEDASLIFNQVKKYGGKEDGVWLSGAKNWDDPRLEKVWGGALRKESDRVIVMPGQEKPLFMSAEMGKVIFQFRSFMFSATQRMLISGLQGQDYNYLGGTLMLTAIGMMAYSFKQWDAGREISSDPTVLIMEGIDRSGSLGMIMELNNTLEKISNNNFGLRPLVGASSPSSRFASRSQLEGMLGPSASFLETSLKVLSAGTQDREWKDSDTRALRRLLPYQNLMILRQGFDKIEESIGN